MKPHAKKLVLRVLRHDAGVADTKKIEPFFVFVHIGHGFDRFF